MIDFELKYLKGFFLSPCNVFWKQKSGAMILIAKKSDYLNLKLIEKFLSSEDKPLFIDNLIDLQLKNDFVEFFKGHHQSQLIKEKLIWRNRLLDLFVNQLSNSEFTQQELNQFAWSAFCKLDEQKTKPYLDLDLDFFSWAMTIATSYTLSAFLMGYYQEDFLKSLYTDTFVSLISFHKDTPLNSLKNEMKEITLKETLNAENKRTLHSAFLELENASSVGPFILAERFDGSGYFAINKNEMCDLEIVLVDLYKHYSALDLGESIPNYFYEVINFRIKGDKRFFAMMRNTLDLANRKSIESAQKSA